jgi:ribosome-associated toxin RatA of RatAB toxin-antitoxin module
VAHAQKSIVINVTREQFFDVIVDYPRYVEFLPEVKKIVVNGTAPDALVTYTIDIKAKTINYTVQMKTQRPASLAWNMTTGEMMKENRGSWTLKEVPGGTEATYDIDLKLGALVPGFIEKALAEQSLPGMLNNFKARAEKLYPKAGA